MKDICYYCENKSKATEKLNPLQLEKLCDSCNEAEFKKGDQIIIQNAPSHSVVFIKEGLVKVHAMGPYKEQILKIVKGPSYLGIPTTIGAEINEYSATAIANTNVCFIEFKAFRKFIKQNGQFAYEIITELCEHEIHIYNKYLNQVQKQGPGKIAEALLFFSEKIFENQTFDLPLTRNELGDLTCTTRETISRILSDFSKNNIIEIDKNKISILNKKQLESISKTG